MKSKKIMSTPVLITLSVILGIYVIFAVRPLPKELQMTPSWTINVRDPVGDTSGKPLLPYKLGQTMGYFTADGKIASSYTFPYKAAISGSYFAQYSGDAKSISFCTSDGSPSGVIKYGGFPFFDGDRIYLFMPGGASFMQCDSSGNELWRYESVCPITAFSSSAAGCVAGFADGTLIIFDHKGNILQEFNPGGSDYQIIFGAALSPNGEYIASISGLKKQRIVLANRRNKHSAISFFRYMDTDRATQTLVTFSGDSSVMYYNYPGGLGVVHCGSGKCTEIPIKGWISAIKESGDSKTSYVLSHEKDIYTVSVIEAFEDYLGSFSFTAKSAFILTDKDSLFVGRDFQISRLAVAKH